MCKIKLEDIIKPSFDAKELIIKDTFPKEIGSDFMENIKIQEDLYFLRTDYSFNQATKMEATQNEKKFVITISQKGDTSFLNHDKQKIEFKEGFTTITLFDKTCGFREFNSKSVKQTRIILGENFLQRNLKESLVDKYFLNKNTLNLLDFSPTMVSSQLILKEILECNLNGELEKMYKQSKVLELLSLELNKLSKEQNSIFLDTYDKDAIYRAKDILIENMQNPPSITQLAKQVHLNEFKLKKGFKQIFKTSPYKLLTTYKMKQAKKLLETSDYNINEIAHVIGYKYASNFTKVFSKEFGVNPKELMKHREYYY